MPTNPNDTVITADEMEFTRKFIASECGLILDANKTYLVESRLLEVARKLGLKSPSDVIGQLRNGTNPVLKTAVIDALTTHETFFFRDQSVFDALQAEVLPNVIAANAATKKLRIWSAACSTGQEAYSISLILREHFAALQGWNIQILGTDISDSVVDRARTGSYSQFEINRGVPVRMLVKYFKQAGTQWTLDAATRGLARFQTCNLLGDIRMLGQFDIIFCRNVLIYFDIAAKRTILDQMKTMMPAHGALFLGSAETVFHITEGFTCQRSGKASYYKVDPKAPLKTAPIARPTKLRLRTLALEAQPGKV